TSKTGKVELKSFESKVSGKVQIKAGSQLNLKASKIDLNPSSLSVEGLIETIAAAVSSAAAQFAAGGGAQSVSGGAGAGAGRPALAGDVVPAGAPSGGPAGAAAGGQDEAAKDKDKEKDKDKAEEAAVAPDEIDLQLVNAAGTPQKKVEVELTLPDASKRAGKTDDRGHFKLTDLGVKGKAKLDVPDFQIAPKAHPPVAGRVRLVEGGVDVEIGKATVVELPSRARRCRLSGLNFETNKTFLLPQAMTGIRMLVKLYKSFEGIEGL